MVSEMGDKIREAMPGGTTNTKGLVKSYRKTYHYRSSQKHIHTQQEYKCSYQTMEQTMPQLDILYTKAFKKEIVVFWTILSCMLCNLS